MCRQTKIQIADGVFTGKMTHRASFETFMVPAGPNYACTSAFFEVPRANTELYRTIV